MRDERNRKVAYRSFFYGSPGSLPSGKGCGGHRRDASILSSEEASRQASEGINMKSSCIRMTMCDGARWPFRRGQIFSGV